uniref:RAD9 checkpoint clamp component B n=1 Tax=Cyprinus carpio carpio TaxID=630221 RepID=A0A9J8DF72_CYPCA
REPGALERRSEGGDGNVLITNSVFTFTDGTAVIQLHLSTPSRSFLLSVHSCDVFGKAVHALSRIGDEIWLDPLEKGLAVRTVNSSQSAYACFCFTPLFFQQYIPDPDIRKDCEAVKCKLNMKCVLPLFRCASWRERSVDKCEISINIPNSRVIFQFHCRHG